MAPARLPGGRQTPQRQACNSPQLTPFPPTAAIPLPAWTSCECQGRQQVLQFVPAVRAMLEISALTKKKIGTDLTEIVLVRLVR